MIAESIVRTFALATICIQVIVTIAIVSLVPTPSSEFVPAPADTSEVAWTPSDR